MSTLWEVPVATVEERELGMSRRLLRSVPERAPRDSRPSRARRERMPAVLRMWGAGPAPAVE